MLDILAKKCRKDIIQMIMNAGSGHIGGALSSIDIYISVLDAMSETDRLIVSHGHTSAALYSALGNMGYFDISEAIDKFRRCRPYEGHPSTEVNGVEWCSGSLGQGLSVGCGFAIAKKIKKEPGNIFVVMGDGEQQKGQLQEAREFAVNHKLDNLIAIIDCNGLQASGEIPDTDTLTDKYKMSGWNVITVDGHCFDEIHNAIKGHRKPLCIIAKTVMGKGIPEIENDHHYHGTVISKDLAEKYIEKFSISEKEQELLEGFHKRNVSKAEIPLVSNKIGRVYSSYTDIRTAMGNALADVATENPQVPILAFDCDLTESVKLTEFKKLRPDSFIECGIAEHNASTAAAAAAKSGVIAIHADFSMFNIAETYSQIRIADINKSPLKLFCTHAGLDVGEDGKTHQCIDYLSLLSNLYGFKVIIPADANQADAAVRYAMSVPYPVAIIGGRSKMPILTDYRGNNLDFQYGSSQWLRRGNDGAIVTYGNMVHRAVTASDELRKSGIEIGVLNCPTPCDIETDDVLEAAKTGFVITYEDHNVKTGIGGEIAKTICQSGLSCRLECLGVVKYGSSTSPNTLYKEQGLDVDSLINLIKKKEGR